MAEFLVRIAVAVPADLDPAARRELVAAERELGRRLVEEGTIVRIWRVPGTTNNVGVWRAADASALHAVVGGGGGGGGGAPHAGSLFPPRDSSARHTS
jgi:muconolactone D-isomerase